MSRSYNRLWHILIDRNMTKTQLREAANITTNAMAKLGKNESVPVETLEKICVVLGCTIDDIMDFEPDPAESRPKEKKPKAKQYRRINEGETEP